MSSSFWIVLDKPGGMSSNHVLGKVKRILGLKKGGFSGTLDPLATGVLPIAFGEALKTMHFMTFSKKSYIFQVRWGQQTTTDDEEGDVTDTSPVRPSFEQIQGILPKFLGAIEQMPPSYSALKIAGKRAYDLARRGQEVKLEKRRVFIYDLVLTGIDDRDYATFHVSCSAGTYVRSLAHDIAVMLGTRGCISLLRRTSVGCFSLDHTISLEKLSESVHSDSVLVRKHSVGVGLDDILAVPITMDDYANAKLGRKVPCSLTIEEKALVGMWVAERFAGFSIFQEGGLFPKRMINFDD